MTAESTAARLAWIDRVVPFAWIAFTALMVLAGLLLTGSAPAIASARHLVWVLIVATWTYPLYTFELRPLPGLIGNVAYAALLVAAILMAFRARPAAGALLVPVVPWIVLASVYTVAQLRSKAR